LGDYQSIYNDIYAIRIGSKWYLTEKTKGWLFLSTFFIFCRKIVFLGFAQKTKVYKKIFDKFE
jgi:hypothetical protein